MAQSTLSVFSPSNFPQNHNSHVHPLFQQILGNLMTFEIKRVDYVLALSEFGSCCGDRCPNLASICDCETGCGYCEFCYREVVALA
jgi:hypothetical protein